MQANFTTIFWNTWFDMQDGTRGNGELVADRLQELINVHNPDVFGLNEVYFTNSQEQSLLLKTLKDNGYHTHFATQTIGNKDQVIGNLFASRQLPLGITDHVFGDKAKSHVSWYKEYTPRLIEATLRINGVDITIITVHLCVIVPSDILTHMIHRLSYNRLTKSLHNKNMIIGGDFNELKYMPPWLHLPLNFKRLTGTFFNQTWLLNGKQRSLLRGNLDNIIFSTAGCTSLVNFEVLDRAPSDHTPLLARFHIG